MTTDQLTAEQRLARTGACGMSAVPPVPVAAEPRSTTWGEIRGKVEVGVTEVADANGRVWKLTSDIGSGTLFRFEDGELLAWVPKLDAVATVVGVPVTADPTIGEALCADGIHEADGPCCARVALVPVNAPAALDAVLRLHVADSYGNCCECGGEQDPQGAPWPCLTVRHIREALTEDGTR